MKKSLLFTLFSSSWVFAQVPQSWYVLPEDSVASQAPHLLGNVPQVLTDSNSSGLADAQKNVENIYSLHEDVLNDLEQPPALPDKWHLHYVATDLTISWGGLIGILSVKSAPTVRAYWMKQGPRPGTEAKDASAESSTDLNAAIVPAVESIPADSVLAYQSDEGTQVLEERINAMVEQEGLLKKIKDKLNFQKQLHQLAINIGYLLDSLDDVEGSDWWLSGVRLDIILDAYGHIGATPMTAGGNIRIRLDWQKAQRKVPLPIPEPEAPVQLPGWMSGLRDFVREREEDLIVVSESMRNEDFDPWQLRLGIGVSVSGDIGAAKGAAAVLGQLMFRRDSARPPVWPSTRASRSVKPESRVATSESLDTPAPVIACDGTMSVVEYNPSWKHVLYARLHHIPYVVEVKDGVKSIVYRVSRALFRHGLQRSVRMSRLFTHFSGDRSKSGWKIYEMRLGYDLSISGDLGLVSVGVTPTAEMFLWNRRF